MTALNFPDSPSNGDTYQGYTYNSTKSAWAKPDSPDPDARTAVYANIAALPTSGTAGDMAYVTATNRLYIWTGTGWYNIALINTNPTISGVNATYGLAIDGTATTVTITASDPEGLPITYSIVSDTSGNTATVTQGTGANTNVFTITPSTNGAHAGTFSLTFRASDGVNIASSAASFTLQFSVVNSKYTTALITSVGANNAVNNSFDDKSTNDHTITAVGNATQTTFSPYRHGGYSTYFDGTTDYLTVASSTEHDFGAGNFCVEFWWWPETVTGNSAGLHIALSSPANSTTQIGYDEGSRKLYFYNNDNGGNIIQNTGVTPTVKAWNHIALCRSGTTVSLYLNGTRAGTATHTSNVSFSGLQIGRYTAGGYEIDGYVRDVRLVKGSSIYDATQASLTVPTEPLTAVTNTTLLACHLPYIADGSTTGHAITVNGNTKTEPFAPYDYSTYSAADHGGSMYFDGTGDRLTFSHASDFSFGTGDFTIEFWIKTPTNAITGGYSRTICEIGQLHIYMRITAYHGGVDSAIRVYDETGDNDVGNVAISDDRWHHVVVVRESGTMKCWVDGKYNTGVSNTRNLSETGTNAIGGRTDGNGHMQGTVADLRVVKGTAVYTGTSNFTPPTAPLTAITNTSLLLNGTDAGIIDKSQSVKSLTLNGDVKSSTAQYKFLSSSIYFDGTGDYLKTPSSGNFLAEGPWTQEMWLRLAGTGGGQTVGPSFGGGAGAWNSSNGHQWLLYIHSSAGFLVQYYGTNNSHNTITIASSAPFTANTWHHWAVSWDGTTLRFFMDGTSVHTTTSFTPNTMTATHTELGRMPDNSYYSQAYYSDVRITKGLARYTANFTPPTAALQG
jgi:hypothetical protein